MDQIGNKHVIPQLKSLGQKGWFGNYRAFFEKYLEIYWEPSGADLNLLEQVILARNDFTHNTDLLSLNSFQTAVHSEKLPGFSLCRFTVERDALSQRPDTIDSAQRIAKTIYSRTSKAVRLLGPRAIRTIKTLASQKQGETRLMPS